MHAIIMILYFQ